MNSRAEKKVAERLASKGVTVYCPLKTVVRQWSDRRVRVEQPFFPSYVFVQIKPEDSHIVLATPGVVNFVYWLRKPAVIRAEEMEEVMRFFEVNGMEDVDVTPIDVGDRVRIVHSPFEHFEGEVLEESKKDAVLFIPQLGMQLKLRLPKSQLEKIS